MSLALFSQAGVAITGLERLTVNRDSGKNERVCDACHGVLALRHRHATRHHNSNDNNNRDGGGSGGDNVLNTANHGGCSSSSYDGGGGGGHRGGGGVGNNPQLGHADNPLPKPPPPPQQQKQRSSPSSMSPSSSLQGLRPHRIPPPPFSPPEASTASSSSSTTTLTSNSNNTAVSYERGAWVGGWGSNCAAVDHEAEENVFSASEHGSNSYDVRSVSFGSREDVEEGEASSPSFLGLFKRRMECSQNVNKNGQSEGGTIFVGGHSFCSTQ